MYFFKGNKIEFVAQFFFINTLPCYLELRAISQNHYVVLTDAEVLLLYKTLWQKLVKKSKNIFKK